MAPRDLDDEDALTTGAAQTDPAGSSLADDAFRWATAEEGRYSGGADETDDARLHTHATVDNTVQEVDVVLVGDADDWRPPSKPSIPPSRRVKPPRRTTLLPCCALRSTTGPRPPRRGEPRRARGGGRRFRRHRLHRRRRTQDRDADQDMTVGHGMAT